MIFSYFKRFGLGLLLVIAGFLAYPAYTVSQQAYAALVRGQVAYAWLASPASKNTDLNRAKVLEDLIQAELAKQKK